MLWSIGERWLEIGAREFQGKRLVNAKHLYHNETELFIRNETKTTVETDAVSLLVLYLFRWRKGAKKP